MACKELPTPPHMQGSPCSLAHWGPLSVPPALPYWGKAISYLPIIGLCAVAPAGSFLPWHLPFPLPGKLFP